MKFNLKFNFNFSLAKILKEKLLRLHELHESEFKKYLLITLGTLGIIITGSVYFIYTTSNSLHIEIHKLQASKKKTRKLLIDFADIDAEETRLRGVLEQHKNFNLKIYFEQFCKDQGVSAVPNWDTTATPINPQVDEIALSATFKGLSTEKLVLMLLAFDKTEIVYVKNLRIKTENDKKISCDITLATVKTKAG